MGGVVGGSAGAVLSHFQAFAEAVVAVGAYVGNNIINAIAGPAARDKIISEFSTQNTYFYTDDAYIDGLHNTDRIHLNSIIKGTSFTDEIINFYRNANTSSDFNLSKALDIASTGGDLGVGGGGSAELFQTFAPLHSIIECNYDLGSYEDGFFDAVPSANLRINNTNLYAGSLTGTTLTNEYDSTGNSFTWQTVLDGDGTYTEYAPTMTSTAFGKIQTNTKKYLKCLGIPEPEALLDDLPYNTEVGGGSNATYSDVIDSVFVNFRVKFVSGVSSTAGNRISNKYLWLFAKHVYDLDESPPTEVTYEEDGESGEDEIHLFKLEMFGDGHNYTMAFSHISTSTGGISHDDYQYNKDLTFSDGYFYYDTQKILPEGDHSAQTVDDVQDFLDSFVNTTPVEEKANWLQIEQNSETITIDGVNSVFPDEIHLSGSGITLKVHDGSGFIDAIDQVLRVGNLYSYKSVTVGEGGEILFANVPDSVYANASVTYGRSNATGVTFYTIGNVSAIERITDYANETNGANTTFRYIPHKLDASNACVSAPIILGILDQLNPFEQHQLIIASANMSMHLAYYLAIEKTWEEKLRAATLTAIKVGAIVFAIISLGSATSLVMLAETAIIAYATSIAVNAAIENILVPVIISNFGEDEALILLAIAAVAIAVYSSKSGTAGLDQFPNQVALFTTSIDIMNQMYTLAVVEPGLAEMREEQEEWTETDSELTEEEEALQEEMDALFGTEDSSSYLLNLQVRAALNPMPASAYVTYHDNILERQFDCFDYEKYNELHVS